MCNIANVVIIGIFKKRFSMKNTEKQQIVYEAVYLCHAKKDENLANQTIELLLEIGLSEKQIISPFIANYSTPLGVDRYEYVSDVLHKRVLVLHLLTNNTYEDIVCNQDIGAISVLNCDYISIVFDNALFVPNNAINPRKQIIDMSDNETNIKSRLGELKRKIEDSFALKKLSETQWEIKRNKYILFTKSNIQSHEEKKQSDCFNDDIKRVISELGDKILFTKESIENLGYTKAKTSMIINYLIESKYIKQETLGRYRWIKIKTE